MALAKTFIRKASLCSGSFLGLSQGFLEAEHPHIVECSQYALPNSSSLSRSSFQTYSSALFPSPFFILNLILLLSLPPPPYSTVCGFFLGTNFLDNIIQDLWYSWHYSSRTCVFSGNHSFTFLECTGYMHSLYCLYVWWQSY